MTVEHLLLALLENSAAQQALYACGANIQKLKLEIKEFVDQTTPRLPVNDTSRETQPTLGFQRVLQRAVFHVQSSGNTEVNGVNVLVAIFSEQDSQAVYLLRRSEVSRLDIVNYISHGVTKQDEEHPSDSVSEDAELDDGKENALSQYAVNLNQLVEEGQIDPLIGREKELERCIQVLCRRRKNNPLFVGEAGVGKTAIAEGLAYRIVMQQTPDVIQTATVYSLDLGALLAGTKYRGDFEKRFKSVLKRLNQDADAILFIDEIHTIIGAGAASGGMMDASNLLKPLLSRALCAALERRLIKSFRGFLKKIVLWLGAFKKIDVEEPSVVDTVKILQGLKSKYEKSSSY